MINRFSQFLVEEEKTVYVGFGRMNPPTIGHGKLLDVLSQKSGRNPYRMFLSQSQDKNKNPLMYKDKVKHARKMFPKHARAIMFNNKVRTALDALVNLYKEGFVNVVMVVGSDRINEFNVLLNKYNGKDSRHGFYNFKSIKIVSAGERDPDSEGTEGASATKQRQYAKDNNFTSFAQGLPAAMTNPDAKKLFNAVRKGMGLKEAKEFKNHIQLEPVSDIRESYLRDNIFKEGEQVVMTKHGIVGNIKYLGTNYIIVESKGETWRCWLDDVSKVDPNDVPPGHVEADFGADTEQGPYRNLSEAQKWKKGGTDGEVHTQHKGQTWRIRKAYNDNERHVGEYHIEVKKKNKHGDHDWHWHDTVHGKDHAKSRLPEASMYKDKPDWGTPESTAKAKKMTPGEVAEYGGPPISRKKYLKLERELTKDELKDREKIAKDLPDADFKKRYGDEWMQVKMATATKMAKENQDPDIKDREGTQPARYHKGLSRGQKVRRDRQFKRQAKMDDNDPAAYKPAPGDKTTKTKPSKYTKIVNKMLNREHNYADPEDRIQAHKKLKSKHTKSGNTKLAKMYAAKIKRDQ